MNKSDDKVPSKKELELIKNINKNIAIKQRLFSQLQEVFDMSNKIISHPEIKDLFIMRASNIESLRERYESVCMEIYDYQLSLESEAQFSDQDLKSFDDLFYRIKLCVSKCDVSCMAGAYNVASSADTDRVSTRPRLPQLELYSFDGNIENFTTFYETFCSLVHNQTTISNIDKFHYLLSCTKGSALNIVKSVPITASNYNVVWQSLLDRYHDNRMLVGKYLDKMLNFPTLKCESSNNLNIFIETFDHSIKAINALDIKDLSSYIFCHIALRALDPATRKSFEQNINQNSIPSYKDLISHIQNQIKILEHSNSFSYNNSTSQFNNQNKGTSINKRTSVQHIRKTFSQTLQSNKINNITCVNCGQNHMIFRCVQFRELTPKQRVSRANHLKLCHNCLKPNHSKYDCKSEYTCFTCNKRHHALLHLDANDKPVPALLASCNRQDSESLVASQNNSSHSSNAHKNYCVLLGTAVVHVIDAYGNEQLCRVLIDSGAQSNFITVNCFERLGLSRRKCNFNIYGLSGNNVKSLGMTSCTIKARHCDSPIFNIDAIILQKITSDLPTVEVPESIKNKFKHLILADPYFHKKSPVDMILAGDIFPDIFDGNKIKLNPSLPTALNSVFGYVLCGKVEVPCASAHGATRVATSCNLVSYTNDSDTIDQTLRSFWEIEESPCDSPISPQDQLAEEMFLSKYYRTFEGRYVSPILLNSSHEPLGSSYDCAMRRFLSLERRLMRSPELHVAYVEFMREYEQLGHMQLYTGTDSKYFIPHHCVIRPSSITTPVRVVFDGSAITSNGNSLNDILLTGKKLNNDVLTIIFNFRRYKICLTADIAKMFRQILIHPADRCYQHIIWRESPSEPIKTYELVTNTYGLRSAPFIAVRSLHQLAYDERERYPRAADVILNGFFVDDLVWSSETFSEACTLQDELIALLKLGGFELRKWASNSPELLSRVDSSQTLDINFDDADGSPLKVLGLRWSPIDDCFSFEYNMKDNNFTKRSVLKLLASIFDPVGFLSPCTFLAKCIMQDLWKLNLGWDEKLPAELCEKWSTFIDSLSSVSSLRVERHMLITQFCDIQLVAFCDASTRGYAACVYVRSVNSNGDVKTRLLASKTKVAPLKPLSIPRLELMAAVLLSKLILYIKQNLKNINVNVTALTDSSVTLAWIQTSPYKLKTFVSTRVAQVVEVVPPSNWFHVRSEHNAADICSRGAMPAQLVAESTRWFHGPDWLGRDVHEWPIDTFYVKNNNDILELKSNIDTFSFPSQNIIQVEDFFEITFSKFSSFMKLQRVIAWCLRFANNCRRTKHTRLVSSLLTQELNTSHNVIIKFTQYKYFSDELNLINNNKMVPSLRKLSPFIDELGFLRVGGRLSQAELSYNFKHPLLLPKRCWVTTLIIEYFHKTYMHVGPRTLQGILCKRYWIINARSMIRTVLSKCITCFKCSPTAIQPVMGTLPATRLLPNKVFNHVGCDIGGPFYIKDGVTRYAKRVKCYMCLFICFSTKAIHIEVLSDLSATCFLATLDRFIARRGLCSCLYSDCGTNFVAAAKHLKDVCKFYKDNDILIADGCSTRQIRWHFNPPAAPNMGGLWEAGIKSAKRHLYRAIGERALTFEELTTVFCKIEAVLNSRPLCPLSNDPNDYVALTAGHFLIGQSLLAVPEYQVDNVNVGRLSRWQVLQKISQVFWKKWSLDYLHTLQQRAKWFTNNSNLKIGDLVLIKSDCSRPLQWPMGRVERLHPGPDNVVRVVSLKTSTGSLKRPVSKVCPLPYIN